MGVISNKNGNTKAKAASSTVPTSVAVASTITASSSIASDAFSSALVTADAEAADASSVETCGSTMFAAAPAPPQPARREGAPENAAEKQEDPYVETLFDSLFPEESRHAKRRKLERERRQGIKTTGWNDDEGAGADDTTSGIPQAEAVHSFHQVRYPGAEMSSPSLSFALEDHAGTMPMSEFLQDVDLESTPDIKEHSENHAAHDKDFNF